MIQFNRITRKAAKEYTRCPIFTFSETRFSIFFFSCCHKNIYEISISATKQHRCVKHGPVINNPKLAEDEGDSERAQKLFCFALKQNSDTVGEENQSSQPRESEGEKKWEPWEALIIVMDLSQLCESHFIHLHYLSNQKCICITFSCTCGCLESKLAEAPVPQIYKKNGHFD